MSSPIFLFLLIDPFHNTNIPEMLSNHARHLLEHLRDACSCLRRNRKVWELLEVGDGLRRVLGSDIAFVGDQHAKGRMLFVLVVEFKPCGTVLEGLRIGDIIDQEAEVGIFEVARNEAFEAFLPGSVPELNAILSLTDRDVFDEEVDADGGLS